MLKAHIPTQIRRAQKSHLCFSTLVSLSRVQMPWPYKLYSLSPHIHTILVFIHKLYEKPWQRKETNQHLVRRRLSLSRINRRLIQVYVLYFSSIFCGISLTVVSFSLKICGTGSVSSGKVMIICVLFSFH